MRLQRLRFMGMLLVLTTCVGTSAIAQTENVNSAPQLPQQYAATAFGQSGGLNGKSIGISLYITQWTSDEDVQAYHATLNKDGSNGLVKALYKSPEIGRLSPTGFVGAAFRIARYTSTPGGGLHIVMVTDRPIAIGENYNGTRSRDYPFGIVVLNVDKDGNGTGTLAPICKIGFNKNGQLEVEHYGQKPLRLANVRRSK